MIPLVDLKAQYSAIRSEIDAALSRVVNNSAFILGDEVSGFERAFAEYCGSAHAVGVASGTAALRLALLAGGIGAGDEVITSPHTFIATAEAIAHTGARPVLVDIDPTTYNLDAELLAGVIGPRTRAVLPVHLYGRPAPMGPILAIARRHGLVVVEDACQAHGARLETRRVGTFGNAGCFSFYPGKNLGAFGDAGMVITDDADWAARLRLLRDHGRTEKYVHTTIGYGERLDALQAAVLGAKLPHLEDWNEKRRTAARTYHDLLAGLPLTLPEDDPDGESVCHLFVVRVADRDRVRQALAADGSARRRLLRGALRGHRRPGGHLPSDLPRTRHCGNRRHIGTGAFGRWDRGTARVAGGRRFQGGRVDRGVRSALVGRRDADRVGRVETRRDPAGSRYGGAIYEGWRGRSRMVARGDLVMVNPGAVRENR